MFGEKPGKQVQWSSQGSSVKGRQGISNRGTAEADIGRRGEPGRQEVEPGPCECTELWQGPLYLPLCSQGLLQLLVWSRGRKAASRVHCSCEALESGTLV